MKSESFQFANKRVLILGMGISGRSAAEFLLFQGAIVDGIDRDSILLDTHPDIQLLKKRGLNPILETDFKDFEKKILPYDLMILSPGIPLTHPLAQKAIRAGIRIMGEIELGCLSVKNRMIGITGTNGKTTVTLLVTHILQQYGCPAKALGNVGIPFTKELLKIDSETQIVLELSSYQIETMQQACLNDCIILNITPNHLDRYTDMKAYAAAKCGIERALKSKGHLYMGEEAWKEYGYLLKSQIKPRLFGYHPTSYIYTDLKFVYREGKKECELPSRFKGKKSHDLENLLAAYALCADCNISAEQVFQAWDAFKKPPHRIEFVLEHRGVRYYDDSKGTNREAVMRAVQSLDGKIILIAGGVDKGADYTPWIQAFKNNVKMICAIGQAAAKIHMQMESEIPVIILPSLKEALQQAKEAARPGDNILLSPGCSSYDMFKDYVHRGQEFQRIVRELVEMEGKP